MKIIIDKSECIGCGLCMGIFPDIFLKDYDGLAIPVEWLNELNIEEVKEAIRNCPVEAISVEE